MITDKNGTIKSVNRAFTEITGYKQSEAIGNTPKILASGYHDQAFYIKMWATIDDTGTWQGEIVNRTKSGKLFHEFLRIDEIKDKTGTITNYIGMFTDITKIKNDEQTLKLYSQVFENTREGVMINE